MKPTRAIAATDQGYPILRMKVSLSPGSKDVWIAFDSEQKFLLYPPADMVVFGGSPSAVDSNRVAIRAGEYRAASDMTIPGATRDPKIVGIIRRWWRMVRSGVDIPDGPFALEGVSNDDTPSPLSD